MSRFDRMLFGGHNSPAASGTAAVPVAHDSLEQPLEQIIVPTTTEAIGPASVPAPVPAETPIPDDLKRLLNSGSTQYAVCSRSTRSGYQEWESAALPYSLTLEGLIKRIARAEQRNRELEAIALWNTRK